MQVVRGPVALGLAAALGAGLLVMVGVTTDLFGRAPPAAAQVGGEAQDVAVVDGATLRIRDRVLRLSGIVVPARGTGCGATDCGAAAAAELAGLVRDRRVECLLDGRRDDRGRPWAACSAGGRDLSTAMVGAGWARAQDDALRAVEETARRRRNGIWTGSF